MNEIPKDLEEIIAEIISYEKIEEIKWNIDFEYLYDYKYEYDYYKENLEENTTIIKISL